MAFQNKVLMSTFLAACYCCAVCHPAFAGDTTQLSLSLSRLVVNDVTTFLEDGGSFCVAPLRFSGRQWLYTAGIVGGTVLLMTGDEDLQER
ncbi:MAG: hypothetical protein O7D34_02300, partial [Ignavibacteria bacterium]|nr:hypothetical protein [Ignavibacteria bacterium]